MPARLRPTGPYTVEAILVGDPGRALLLAQELLDQPKMCNHARGLWGYSGRTPAGDLLTIQSTGMGGPSAALVLGDLAELGVRSAVRVGTCVGVGGATEPGELLVVSAAVAAGGSAAAHGVGAGEAVTPDEDLTGRLEAELGDGGRAATIASFDAHPDPGSAPSGVAAADMQTAPLLARAASLGVKVGALLIVAETAGVQVGHEELEAAEKRAGRLASAVLSP